MKIKKAFLVFFILLAVLFAVLLELGKNTLLGWFLALALFAAFFVLHGKALSKKKLPLRLLSWPVFILLLAGVFLLSAPPEKQVPAVENRHPAQTDVITVAQGQVRGVKNKDETVEVFAGIPYAKPPVGELRWKAPQPAEKWSDVRECDTFAPMSMQPRNHPIYDTLTQLVGFHRFAITPRDNYIGTMSEDSLYLNIWRPVQTDENTPVLFFIHGGSLTSGETWYSEYNGESLAKKGVIVVNCAYRLGVFGYYANAALQREDDHGTTGNYGLLDQIAALQWVHDNIASFGGDPDNITIAGESAGSSSVNALCVSPLAKGLFKRAIAESSGICGKAPYHTFRTLRGALQTGRNIQEEFGAETVDDLRNVPADELVNTKYHNNSMCTDGYAIIEEPYYTYLKHENNEEALLNGFNAHESDVFTYMHKIDAENYEAAISDVLGSYAAEAVKLYPPEEQSKEYSLALVEAGGSAKGSLNKIISVAWINYSHYVWSNALADEDRDVYLYYFTKDNGSLGSNHAGELPYAYGNLRYHAKLYDETDFALTEAMQQYWVNFIKTGDPNGEGLPEWPRFNDDRTKVMELGTNTAVTELPDQKLLAILDTYQEERAVEIQKGNIENDN